MAEQFCSSERVRLRSDGHCGRLTAAQQHYRGDRWRGWRYGMLAASEDIAALRLQSHYASHLVCPSNF